jgi:hypothetical protein
MIPGRPETVIVVTPQLASFYEFVKARQEREDHDVVVLLDRRRSERRQTDDGVAADRRRGDRRTLADGASAQLAVLGFSILHRAGERYTA